MKVSVTFLDHSGFWLEWENCCWLFDYYRGELPALSPGKKLFVFCSHSHRDHFNPAVFDLYRKYPHTEYIFSGELKRACAKEAKKWGAKSLPAISYLAAWEDRSFDDGAGNALTVHAMCSTDCGAAFVLAYQGRTVYHAGDLHWWIWPGEPEKDNRQMTGNYKKEMQYLEGKQIDLAFSPLDPRLEEYYDLGMDYLLAHARVDRAFPMHFWEDFSVTDRYLSREKPVPGKTEVIRIERTGQKWEFDL